MRKEQLRFYRKLEGMLDMNEAVPRALERLYQAASFNGKKPDRPMAIALRAWRRELQKGLTLSEAFDGWLPDRDLMLIRAGEESGALAQALRGIQAVDGTSKRMKGALMKAISYPTFIFVLMIAVLYIFGVQLVDPIREMAPPQVAASLAGLGQVSDFLRSIYAVITFAALAAAVAGLYFSLPYWRGKLRAKFDLWAPWSWYRLWHGSMFLLSLSALMGAQMPLARALNVLSTGAKPWLAERMDSARQEVMRGRNLGEALEIEGLNFPDPAIVNDLVVLAERTDVAKLLDTITHEWMDDQMELLEKQAQIIRVFGLAGVGGIIAWTMLSIVGLTQSVAQGFNAGSM